LRQSLRTKNIFNLLNLYCCHGVLEFSDHWYEKSTAFELTRLKEISDNNLTITFLCFSPVDCIHWTSAAQLSLLEDEMRRVERVNVRENLQSLLLLDPFVLVVSVLNILWSLLIFLLSDGY